MKPRLLDLFCGEGGAGAGYVNVGFDVLGVDVAEQSRYPYRFTRSCALEFLRTRMDWIRATFQAIHASPPCQRYTKSQRIRKREHPDLIEPTRLLLIESGLPFVIENVPGAPLLDPITLCGASFGLRTYRHREFEAGGGLELTAPAHLAHTAPTRKMGRLPQEGEMMHVVGNFPGVNLVREDWRMPWASRNGLSEAIPPAYTEWVGGQLFDLVS